MKKLLEHTFFPIVGIYWKMRELEMLLGQGPHKLEKLKARTKTKARKIPFAIKRKLETGKCYC